MEHGEEQRLSESKLKHKHDLEWGGKFEDKYVADNHGRNERKHGKG